jgi:hypothetical protein
MIDKCQKCGSTHIVKMQTSASPITGKMGFIQCMERGCKYIHEWPKERKIK